VTFTASTYEDLSCQEVVELVTDYLEGALTRELHARFEQHIAHCTGCQSYLQQMRATIRTTGTLTAESISPEAEQALRDAFRGWRSPSG
jgi:anti-sigma factor RsiW